jgi:hypothetical protein
MKEVDPEMLFFLVIFHYGLALKCVNRLLLPEFSYNANYVWSGVIVHTVRPVSQWMFT